MSDHTLSAAAEAAQAVLPRHRTAVAATRVPASLTLRHGRGPRPGGYRLTIAGDGAEIVAASPSAVCHGVQTLRQIAAQSPAGAWPALRIDDWPAFANRGVYLDVSRGRVPKIERFLQAADLLAAHKVNQIQLYIEHTFAFRGHPDIGRGASPLTPGDILALDARCRRRCIELVPSLACFGHLAKVLRLPAYRQLAEDWGIGRYTSPDAHTIPAWARRKGWSLAPANPAAYRFLDALFAEFLPLFSSGQFNVCCDETMDLGMGQSYALARRKGRGRLYLDHILRLRDLAGKYGKRILFWGDIIRRYPELIPEIPKDVTVLDWGYTHDHPFERVKDFRGAGVPFYVCPGTSGWCSLFPRLPEAAANIRGFVAAGRRHGAAGVLNTDWGDGGHFNFLELSWHGLLCGAEQAWNPDADPASFTRRFARVFLGTGDAGLVRAIDDLGRISGLCVDGYYQSVWQHIFFARPDSGLFAPAARGAWVYQGDRIEKRDIVLDARLGRQTLARLGVISKALDRAAGAPGADPNAILPYWSFAVATLAHAARKLTILGNGGRDSAGRRRGLRREMAGLLRGFQQLWRARNRPSEIRITVARYRAAMRALERG